MSRTTVKAHLQSIFEHAAAAKTSLEAPLRALHQDEELKRMLLNPTLGPPMRRAQNHAAAAMTIADMLGTDLAEIIDLLDIQEEEVPLAAATRRAQPRVAPEQALRENEPEEEPEHEDASGPEVGDGEDESNMGAQNRVLRELFDANMQIEAQGQKLGELKSRLRGMRNRDPKRQQLETQAEGLRKSLEDLFEARHKLGAEARLVLAIH